MDGHGMDARAERTRVAIIDSEPIGRTALQAFMKGSAFQVVEAFATGAASLAGIVSCNAAVVVLDLELPDCSASAIVTGLMMRVPRARILVVTRSLATDDVVDALRAGASGYLPKSIAAPEFLAAMDAVAHGETVLSEKVAQQVRGMLDDNPPLPVASYRAPLTGREREILRLIAEGLDNQQIARELFVSRNTVKNHVAHILEKLSLHNRVQLAVHAVRFGFAAQSTTRPPRNASGADTPHTVTANHNGVVD